MIVITGAAGFIGSCMLSYLNSENYKDIVIVDDFTKENKLSNYSGKIYNQKVERVDFFNWLLQNERFVQIIIHLGARTDTTEFDKSIFDKLNFNYSKEIWNSCVKLGLPLIYASSAATYGMGELGFDDNHEVISTLKPLNPYGESKNNFDKWVLEQEQKPFFWAGLKFFNVYGPNEYHKARMASVAFHAYNQIKTTGKVKLFKSHHPEYSDGEQLRDFIYVKDIVDVIHFLMQSRKKSGIYNLGTGKARSFVDLVSPIFSYLGMQQNIEFIDTPIDIRDKYQYFTEAKMDKLIAIGYEKKFTTLEDGVNDYVKYLSKNLYY